MEEKENELKPTIQLIKDAEQEMKKLQRERTVLEGKLEKDSEEVMRMEEKQKEAKKAFFDAQKKLDQARRAANENMRKLSAGAINMSKAILQVIAGEGRWLFLKRATPFAAPTETN